jgi:hypothetical protein
MSLLDRFFARLFWEKEDALVRRLAGRIVSDCRSAIRNRVGRKSRGMGPAALRGYVRAYAAGPVAAEAKAAAMQHGWNLHFRQRIVDKAAEQLVDLLVGDLATTGSTYEGHAAAA